jgi:hypothetical protein
MRKVLSFVFDEVLKTLIFMIEKEQLEYVLRGVVGGSLVAFILGDPEIKPSAMLLFFYAFWLKRENHKRKDAE